MHPIDFKVLADQGYDGLSFLSIRFLSWPNACPVFWETRTISSLNWMRNLASMIELSVYGYAFGGATLSFGVLRCILGEPHHNNFSAFDRK